jgi:hypothetical protein
MGKTEPAMTDPSPSAARPTHLALVCLSLFVVILPLTLPKPGLPQRLKADESAYYLLARSIWHDGDTLCEDEDLRRLFEEYSGTGSLLLFSNDGGESIYFGVPIMYPILATPFVAVLGSNGMVVLNAGMLVGMLWMGVLYLRR